APGEAEAELVRLNEEGGIDGILTEESDAFIFGAQFVIRTLGMTPTIYSLDSIENTERVAMDKAGLLLCVLLLGGDYASGVLGINPAIAHALAVQGFGQELVDIVTCSKASDLDENLSRWREAIRDELRTNSSGHLANHYLELADEIPDTFPDL
ncbi:hypothetical protein B0H14DRAFT_2166141, partial [Mycena olivaceomarginata]